MNQKIVYQIDPAGCLVGETMADESPLEPGVWLMPFGTIETPPPESWPDDKTPRWNGKAWGLTHKQAPAANNNDPVAKLRDFLAANPDVAAIIQGGV